MPEPMSPHATTPTLDTSTGVLIAHAPPCAFAYPPTRSRRSEFGARCWPSRLPPDHHRDALPAADAGGGQTVRGAAAAQLVHQGEEKARPRGPQRMAERDGPAVDVGPLTVQAQLLLDREVLAGASLVHLHDVHVPQGETGTLQRLARRGHGTDAHDLRGHARDRPRHDARERPEPAAPCLVLVRHHEGGRAVHDPARVAGGDEAVPSEGRLEPAPPPARRV